jgi:hypothetical protein
LVVEKGLVICCFSKDYEIQSWNEQGEILRKEGMLAIALSNISFCSHIEKKNLYLIIKIHYTVNMSEINSNDTIYNKDLRNMLLKKELSDKDKTFLFRWLIQGFDSGEWDDVRPYLNNLFDEYKNNLGKIKDFELKINKLESQNSSYKEKLDEITIKIDQAIELYKKEKGEKELLKKDNLRLKIISGEAKSGWQKDRDLIFRDNPDTGKFEQYKCPIKFEHDVVSSVKYLDNKRTMIKFYHNNFYEMPTDAYEWLKGNLPEQKKDKVKKIEPIEIEEYDELIKHIELFGFFEYNFRKLENVFKFLKEHKGKTFQRQYFTGNCDISPRTVSKYLKMLEECKLIIKLPGKGKHKVNIK